MRRKPTITQAAALFLIAGAAVLVASAPTAAAADTAAPAVLGYAPVDGGYVNHTKIYPGGVARTEVTAEFVDLNSGLIEANVSITLYAGSSTDPVLPEIATADSDINGASISAFSLYYLVDGVYRLELWAADNANNTVVQSSNFTVDLDAPILTVSAPRSTQESTIHVSIGARDDVSGVAMPAVLSYKSACSYSWFTVPVEAIEFPGRMVGDADVPVCVGSNNQFTVVINDRAGNTATFTQSGIACDLSGPTYSGFNPPSFDRLDGPSVDISVTVSDDASGVDVARVEYRVSDDGGVVWRAWVAANVSALGRSVQANATVLVSDGATVGLEWRAWDNAGNGPTFSRTEFFYVNGPPFLEFFAPEDGTVIYDYNQIRIRALADDPDADTVAVTVSSDIDGILGAADNRAVRLSLGVHNLTVALDDGHNHVVHYVYQVQVIPRPPPDPRPLMMTAILAGVMLWFTYAAYTKDEEPDVAGVPKA